MAGGHRRDKNRNKNKDPVTSITVSCAGRCNFLLLNCWSRYKDSQTLGKVRRRCREQHKDTGNTSPQRGRKKTSGTKESERGACTPHRCCVTKCFQRRIDAFLGLVENVAPAAVSQHLELRNSMTQNGRQERPRPDLA